MSTGYPHTLTYTAGTGGTISGTTPQTVNYGADGTAVTADISVTANFAVNTATNHTISASFGTSTPPVIDSFTTDKTSGNAPLTVTFICTAHDPDGGNIVQYLWRITGPQADTLITTASSLIYRFLLPGNYSVSVTVTDDEGETATADLEDNGSGAAVTVENCTPVTLPIPGTLQITAITKDSGGSVETTAVNEFDGNASVALTARDESGNAMDTSTVTVPANGSALLPTDSFDGIDYDRIEVVSDRHLLFFSRIYTDTANMTAELSDNLSSPLLVSHIAEETDYWNTYAYLSNSNPANLDITVAGQTQAWTAVFADLIDLESLLPNNVSVADAWGMITSFSSNPFGSRNEPTLTGFEMFIKTGSDGAATELVSQNSTVLYIPHIPEETDIFWTGFALLNPGSSQATITATLYDDDGTVVGTETLTIPANSKIKGLMANLFPAEAGTAKWGIFRSDQAINGIEIYGTYNAGICGLTLPVVANSWGILPDILTGENNWTGIAVTNVTGATASVTIQLVGADGIVKAEKIETIAAMHRFKAVVADYFSTAAVASGDTVRYISDQPVIALEASGDLDRTFMTALTGSR